MLRHVVHTTHFTLNGIGRHVSKRRWFKKSVKLMKRSRSTDRYKIYRTNFVDSPYSVTMYLNLSEIFWQVGNLTLVYAYFVLRSLEIKSEQLFRYAPIGFTLHTNVGSVSYGIRDCCRRSRSFRRYTDPYD